MKKLEINSTQRRDKKTIDHRLEMKKHTNHRNDNMFKTVKRLIKAAIAGALLTTIIRKINNRTDKSKDMQGNGNKK